MRAVDDGGGDGDVCFVDLLNVMRVVIRLSLDGRKPKSILVWNQSDFVYTLAFQHRYFP